MTATSRKKWLVLDDCASDRRRMSMALANTSVEVILTSTVSEAQDILERNTIDVCILDFFLRGTSSRHLISSIRERFPAMPIIVISSHAGKEESIYKAGADAVLPKLSEFDAFATILRNAVAHACSLRDSKVDLTSEQNLYMAPALKADFKKVCASSTGNILVISGPGMGRTKIATALAKQICEATFVESINSKAITRRIFTFTCTPQHTLQSVDAALFGVAGQAEGLIAAAQNGVLILDDVHLLSLEIQEKLKVFMQQGIVKSNEGTMLHASCIRLIFTSAPPTEKDSFTAQLVKLVMPHVINLPPIAHILKELPQIIEFFFSRASPCKRMRPEKEVVEALMGLLSEKAAQVTLRSLSNAIYAATRHAAKEGRVVIQKSDFEDFENLYDPQIRMHSSDQMQFILAYDDRVGINPWIQLYDIARTGSLTDAQDLLRKMMIEYAMLMYSGNKTKVASQLGVARQHLYKPCLKTLHQTEY